MHKSVWAVCLAAVLMLSACSDDESETGAGVDTSASEVVIKQLQDAVDSEAIMKHLRKLEQIADANNGNRASGTNGYVASVAYFKQQLESQGFTVTEQHFDHRSLPGTLALPGKSVNLIAELPSSGAGDHVVMLGAHLDSVLAGPGINDNGSGAATLLEIALQMAKYDTRPRNTIRFAWWGAEEIGVQGSLHYMNGLSEEEKASLAAYLNFDMIGAKNAIRTVYAHEDSSRSKEFENLFEAFFARRGLDYEEFMFLDNNFSDYYSYFEEGVPYGGLGDGYPSFRQRGEALAAKYGGNRTDPILHPCYHQSCDTLDTVDEATVKVMADAIVEVSYKLANDTTFADSAVPKNMVSQKLNDLAESTTISMVDCPERVWPDYSWRGKQVVFHSARKQLAVLWAGPSPEGGTTPEITVVEDYSALPSQAINASFGRASLNGKDTLFVSADASFDDTAVLAFHEGFHMFGQSYLSSVDGLGQPSRGETVPEDPEPRVVRAELMSSLLDAVVDRADTGAAHATYWHEQYAEKHASDKQQQRFLDLLEGSAEYVGERANAIGKLGCSSAEETIFQSYAEQSRYEDARASIGDFKDQESYFIGSLSGFLLARDNISGWEKQNESGTTMMDLLASNTLPITDTPDDPLAGRVRQRYEQINSDNLEFVNQYLELRNAEDSVRVNIPGDWLGTGSTAVSRMLTYDKDDEKFDLVEIVFSEFASPASDASLSIKSPVVIESVSPGEPPISPCEGFSFGLLPLSESVIAQLESTGDLTTAALEFSSVGVQRKTDSRGQAWACLF